MKRAVWYKFQSVLAIVLLSASTPAFAQDWTAKAREEKSLVVYHTTNVPDTQKILDGFRKRAPYLAVEPFRATGEKLIQKIATEVKAGRNLADVYIISGLQAWLLKDAGYIAPYASPERERINPALKDRDGYWSGIYWNLEVLGYNAKQVTPQDVPKRWEDLTRPRWKGQIGLEEEDVQWYASILQLMGEEKGKELMRRIALQNPQIRRGHTLLGQLMAAGEFALTPTLRVHEAESLKSKGAPIEWHAIEPLAPNPPVCVMLPKSAPRPNAAKVFIDYILSRAGQEIFRQMGRNSSRVDLEQPIARVTKIKLMEMDWERVQKNYARYAQEFRDTFVAVAAR
ncbi:MAG TPA: extracellular solute-binding protein [Candidatus Binatia bacterium]|nr:extracellular solute-binding protein [Candidatus Binatia bacterium]